ncbi:MAG: hypothetical protein AAB415_00765 [Patescibacteria group bacterium]
MSADYANSLGKHFLAAETLARRESVPLTNLIAWCEDEELRARRIKGQWFIDLADWAANNSRLVKKLDSNPIKNIYSPLLLATISVFFIAVMVFTPLQTRFRAGSALLGASLNTVTQTIAQDSSLASLAAVYDGLWLDLDQLWFSVRRFTQTVRDNLIYFWQAARGEWRGFMSREPPEISATPSIMDPTTLENLKAEIKAELFRELGGSQNVNLPRSVANPPGLVVLPSSGSPVSDEALKLELKNSFSDQVEVKFDASGQAGIITPINSGENYLFILTPLKRRP